MLRNLPSQRYIWLVGAIMLIAGATALISLIVLNGRMTPQERLEDRFERGIRQLETVQGRMNIRHGTVTLHQELWVRHPGFLRTETEKGPSAFSGTIVVLNDNEGWVFSSALNMATVVNRSEYTPEMAGDAGAGSLLERIPAFLFHAFDASYPINIIGSEQVAGRQTTHLEIVVPHDDAIVPSGILQVWIDDKYGYPLAWQDSSGREMRFASITFNGEIDPAVFTFVPPPSASVRRVNDSN